MCIFSLAFIQYLIKDPNIRSCGSSGLFYYTVLCCYANFRTSFKKFDGISYTIYPGDWICRINELNELLRCKSNKQTIDILENLQDRHLIEYSLLSRGKLVKFTVINWRKTNRVLDYNAPCQKETGFFFLPISIANELVSSGKCSELDAILDLWINTVYNDKHVQGSNIGPIVYIRNGTGNPLLSCEELALRWGISKATVSRYLNKFKKEEYIITINFQGSHGSAICIKKYLSTMFEISDILIDKAELAMALNIDIQIPSVPEQEVESPNNITVSKYLNCVSKTVFKTVIQKVSKILLLQGFPCSLCSKIQYILLPLSECKNINTSTLKVVDDYNLDFLLLMKCSGEDIYKFEVSLRRSDKYDK